jgi:hypothetical protein
MLKIARHFVFTIAMIAWAGLCLYLMEKAQQVPVALYLSPFVSYFHWAEDTIESAQSAYQALVGALLVLVMLFPAFLYKKSFPDPSDR